MTRSAEQALIERAKAGDRDAISDLVRAHQESLYTFMLRMSGRPDVAEDVVQEAFVRVLKNLDRFDPRFRFSTWLFTIAKRLYVNWMQKFYPIPESDIVDAWHSDRNCPREEAQGFEEAKALRLAVARGLESLGEVQKEIVLLFHQQDWSIAEISGFLHMPEGTIKSHLHRARRKMRDAIERMNPQAFTQQSAQAMIRLTPKPIDQIEVPFS